MSTELEIGTPARSLPPIPDEALVWAETALGMGVGRVPESCSLCDRGHCPTHDGRAAVVAAYPILARAVLEWAADHLDETANARNYTFGQKTGMRWGAVRLRRLAREATTERTQP